MHAVFSFERIAYDEHRSSVFETERTDTASSLLLVKIYSEKAVRTF